MNNELDYYLIGRENNEHYPLLIGDDGCPAYEYEDRFIENPEHMQFCFGKPTPRKPKVVDYHSTPYSVVSDKIASVLISMNITGMQLIPASITGKKNEVHKGYYFLNIYNLFPALDRDKSIYEWSEILKEANPIEKLVLNEKYLLSHPLKERLVFRLTENPVEQLYHQSVVDAIMSTQPEGVSFCHVKDWNMGVPFE